MSEVLTELEQAQLAAYCNLLAAIRAVPLEAALDDQRKTREGPMDRVIVRSKRAATLDKMAAEWEPSWREPWVDGLTLGSESS